MRIGGIRTNFEGQYASLWHYLPNLRANIVRVFHMDYSETAFVEILKYKALSVVLSEDPLV